MHSLKLCLKHTEQNCRYMKDRDLAGQQDTAKFTGYMGNLCVISWCIWIDTDDVLSYNRESYDQV